MQKVVLRAFRLGLAQLDLSVIGLFVAGAMLGFGGNAARCATSNLPIEIFGLSVNIDGTGTQLLNGNQVTSSNAISGYQVTDSYAVEGVQLPSFTLGSGGSISAAYPDPDAGDPLQLLQQISSSVVYLNGGSISETGTYYPQSYVSGGPAVNDSGGTLYLTGTLITNSLPGDGVYLYQGSMVMTGGQIDSAGADIDLGSSASLTLAGGVLGGDSDPTTGLPIVYVDSGSVINLFGSGFTYNGVALVNGSHAEQLAYYPTFDSVIAGQLLSGQSTDFALNAFSAGQLTINVNVGTPPAVPEPVGLGLMSLIRAGTLRRRRR